jgi:hypothetical protein
MSRADLEKRLIELTEEHQRAMLLQYRLEGAIAVLRELLAQEERVEVPRDGSGQEDNAPL